MEQKNNLIENNENNQHVLDSETLRQALENVKNLIKDLFLKLQSLSKCQLELIPQDPQPELFVKYAHELVACYERMKELGILDDCNIMNLRSWLVRKVKAVTGIDFYAPKTKKRNQIILIVEKKESAIKELDRLSGFTL